MYPQNLHQLFTIVLFSQSCRCSSSSANSTDSPVTYSEWERVVSDLEQIYGAHGVPTNFGYNETVDKSQGGFGSAPGCPKSIDGFPWIYYGKPPRCFLAGHYGPCPLGEKILSQLGSPFGICSCECLAEEDNSQQLLKNTDRYLFCRKLDTEGAPYAQIYDKQESKCYSAFERGPCLPGTVITAWKKDSLKCLPLCDYSKNDWITLAENGVCGEPPVSGFGAAVSIIGDEECPDSQRYSEILKKCVKAFGRASHVG